MSCDVGGCGRSVLARGLCSGHYSWAKDRDFEETPTHQLQEYSQPDEEHLKKCTNCGEVKWVGEFYRNKNFTDGRSYQCKKCCNERTKARNERRRDRIRQIKEAVSCQRCGKDDWRVLQFHHVRGEKDDAVSQMLFSYGWRSALEEVRKCDVLCSNCHHLVEHYGETYESRSIHHE